MKSSGKLVLVRHGESTWNKEDRFAGATNVPLTPYGITQAQEAGILLKDHTFDVAYTSTLQRAIDTLEHMGSMMQKTAFEIKRSAKLNERNFGSLEGQLKAYLMDTHGEEQVERWRFGWDEPMPDGLGERFAQMSKRVLDFYESEIAIELATGKHILVVAHGQVLRAISMHLEGAGAERAREFMMENAVPRIYHMVDTSMARISRH